MSPSPEPAGPAGAVDERAVPPPDEWDDPDPSRPLPFWDGLRRDVIAHVPPEQRRRSRGSWARAGLAVAVRSSGLHVTALYRAARAARDRGGAPGAALAAVLFWLLRHGYGCAIAPTARLHGGLILPHPQGIVIGPGAVVGPRAWIYQNVTIGGAPGRAGYPRVGADARIFCGAVLSGPIRLGDNVMVGANVVVHRDVPSRTAVRPAAAEFGPLPSAGVAVAE